MNSGRYCSSHVVIPAPEMPPTIKRGGNQHQLEAMKAESNAPKLAYRSPPFDGLFPQEGICVAPGDGAAFVAQQSAAATWSDLISFMSAIIPASENDSPSDRAFTLADTL